MPPVAHRSSRRPMRLPQLSNSNKHQRHHSKHRQASAHPFGRLSQRRPLPPQMRLQHRQLPGFNLAHHPCRGWNHPHPLHNA